LKSRSAPAAVAALVSVLGAACAGRVGAPDDTTMPDGGAVVLVPCNDLTNDAPTIHPTCEGTCSGCPQSGTPAIPDGMYALKNYVSFGQDCSLLTTSDVRAKLRIAGGTMNLVIQEPAGAAGDTVTERMTYMFQLSGGLLNLQQTCPSSDAGVTNQVVSYASDGKAYHFTFLPGTNGDTVFTRQ
jgi:hypothetical protein